MFSKIDFCFVYCYVYSLIQWDYRYIQNQGMLIKVRKTTRRQKRLNLRMSMNISCHRNSFNDLRYSTDLSFEPFDPLILQI